MLLLLSWLVSVALAGTCDVYEDAEFVLDVTEIESTESSGLAASRTRGGVFFTHDDSGTESQIYSFSLDGDLGEAHFLDGGSLVDWEDMAAAPCPESIRAAHSIEDCLYIGDIGDNPRVRSDVRILVIAEPSEGASVQVLATWRLRYPGEPQDSETLLIHPGTGQITLVSKSWTGTAGVYITDPPFEDGGEVTLSLVTELSLEDGDPSGSLFTGGDWDMDGERLVLRTYGQLYLWETDPCEPDSHWGDVPRRMQTTWEWQGEAVCFDMEGHLLTSSEGSPMPVSRIECSDWTPSEGPCAPESGGEDTSSDSGFNSADGELDEHPGSGHPSGTLSSRDSTCGRSAAAPFVFLLWGMGRRSRQRDHSAWSN
jgi:hypothetical protein